MRGVKGSGEEIDSLFQLPLGEFTAARNALASRLKKAGNTGEANEIKSLAKPSIAAWAANQLYWKHRAVFDRLLEAGGRFRDAQAAQLAGKSADLREPLEARRSALSELSARAADILRDGGSAAAPDTMRRVTTTLEALSTYGGLAGTPQPGRLTDDVQPPGFEALAALVPRVDGGRGTGPTRVIPFQHRTPPKKSARRAGAGNDKERAAQRKEQLGAARAAVTEAERA